MPRRATPAAQQHDAIVQPSVKNVFDRQPLLIPRPLDDRQPPWYRRRAVLTFIVLLVAVAVVGVARFGATLLRALGSILGR